MILVNSQDLTDAIKALEAAQADMQQFVRKVGLGTDSVAITAALRFRATMPKLEQSIRALKKVQP